MVTLTVPDRPEGLAIGDFVEVRIGTIKKYYQIINRDTIFYVDKHPSISAGSESGYTSIDALDPPSGQLYQFYAIMVDGNVKVFLKQPAATNRWGTEKSPEGGMITDKISPVTSGQLVNLWCYEDFPPVVNIKNDTNVSIAPTLYWFGWRYEIVEVPKPAVYTPIVIGGLSR